MKSFRQIVLEVAQPVAGDEADFKAKHVTTKVSHPTAPDHVFSGSTRKAPKRRADYDKGEDEAVYEGSFDVPTAEGGEHDSEDSHQKYKKGNKSSMKEAKKMDPVGQEDDDIDNDGDTDSSDKYLHARRRAIGKAMKKEEVEELGEISRDLARSYIRKAMAPKHTGEKSKKDRSAGVTMAGKKAYSIPGEPKVRATESVELDEISQEKLSSYYDKAAADRKKAKSQTQKAMTDKNPSKDTIDTGTSAYKRFQRRGKGMTMAANKMKEETELDEARKSDSYQFTHKPGDAESEKRLADLKKSVKGTGKRVVLQGRLGKDNPNAHKYSKDAPRAQYKDGKRVNSDVSGKSGAHSHQRIQKADAAHHDVYVYDRRESVELDEVSKSTLASYIKKASKAAVERRMTADRLSRRAFDADVKNSEQYFDASDRAYRKSKNRISGIEKASDRLAKEEVEQVDEISRATAIDALRKRQSHADDFYSEPNDQSKADATRRRIQKKFGSKTAKDAERGVEIDRKGRPQDTGPTDYLDAKSDVYSKFSRPNSKKGTAQRLDYMKLNKGRFRKEEVEQVDEVSKSTLASYIKKASHDVATKSAATGRYGERSNKEADTRKKTGDTSGYRQGREDAARADKFFRSSWKRRMGIAKAADKLAKEEVELDEDFNAIAKDHDMAAKKHRTAYATASSSTAQRNHEIAYNRHTDAAKAHREAANDKNKHSSEKLEKMSNRAWDATDHVRKHFDEEFELDEVLKPTTKMGTWIKDFQKSDAPQFKGKSQEKRRQMAIAAKYGAEREAGMREEAELEEKLVGGQKELDHNKNGKIDAHDFHLMRKKKMKEEVELDEDITKMSHGRLKWHMNTGVPHGSYTKDEMKKERDRRLKTDPMSYRSAKAGLSEVTQSAVKKTVTYTGSDGKSHTRNVPLKKIDRDEHGQDKIRESTELTEIFNRGIVKLKDGGSVILKKEDADLLNQMFKDLSSGNRKKMQEIAMKDKAGFNEILSFAKEAL